MSIKAYFNNYKWMKKVYLLFVSIVTVYLAAISILKVNEDVALLDLAFENVEALALEEAKGVYTGDYVSYIFDGTSWWGNKTNSSGNMFPKYDSC